MIDTKELRRLAQANYESNSVDSLYALQDAFDYKTVLELLDRLEAWENVFSHLGTPDEVGNEWHALSDRLEAAEKAACEAYRRGYATGQEEIEAERDALLGDKATLQQMVYSLKDRVEVVEKEYQHVLEVKEIYQRQLNETEDERDALRAKIEAMEKQEPVGSIYIDGKGDREFDDWKCDLAVGSNLLYTLPGAQPAPIEPEGWKLVPIEPTEEMIRIATAEYVQASSRRLHPNIAWRRAFQALLTAAPEAKP